MPRKILLTVCAFALALVSVEIGLRVALAMKSSREAEARRELGLRPPPTENVDASFASILRPSPNPRLVYELRPSLRTRFRGERLTTDSRGFRVAQENQAGADSIRLFGVGDSVMFGWGVSDNETFLARLPSLLSRQTPRASWSTTNAAVPGYNTVMAVETLLEKGMTPSPDVVVLTWVNNDLDLPSFLRRLPSVVDARRLFLFDWAFSKIVTEREDPFDGPRRIPARRFGRDEVPDYFARLSEQERALVGLESFERAMKRLAVVSSEQGLPVVVLAPRRAPRFVKRTCRGHGFTLVVAAQFRERFAREKGRAKLDPSDLVVSLTDPHPSPLGHELLAFALAQHLAESSASSEASTPPRGNRRESGQEDEDRRSQRRGSEESLLEP